MVSFLAPEYFIKQAAAKQPIKTDDIITIPYVNRGISPIIMLPIFKIAPLSGSARTIREHAVKYCCTSNY